MSLAQPQAERKTGRFGGDRPESGSSPREGRPLSDRERELGAIIAAYNDVTERLKDSHERLQREVHRLTLELADKNRELARRERLVALGEMAAGLAHEIRNPLGGIQLFAGLLTRDLADRPRECELARKISKGVQTLEKLVTDILAFAGQAEPRFCVVDLPRLIDETVELAGPAFHRAGATAVWSRDACNADPCIDADPCQLQQALLNLLQNAAEAAGAGGRVDIGVTGEQDGFVRVTVSDDGDGIPRERLDRIFNPFFTTKDRGTGLGLAIVHRIAEAHGGSIRAANREGGGAVFSLTLPRRHEGEMGSGSRVPGSGAEARGGDSIPRTADNRQRTTAEAV
jgi:signal transduction histidine kinase